MHDHTKKSDVCVAGSKLNVISDDAAPAAFVQKLTKQKTAMGDDDPFYVLNVTSLLSRHREWMQHMPRIQPYYAVKSNPDPVLLQVLAWLGVNFDCASKGEIDLILNMGLMPNRIIYANTTKQISYIRYAAEKNVRLMTFDNEEELYKIKKAYPDAHLVLRIAVLDATAKAQLSKKFGAEPTHAAPKLMHLATELGLQIVGISFHVGGMSKNPHKFAEGIAEARSLFNLGKSLGHNMRTLDLGGGYPGFDSPDITFARIAAVINEAIDEHFPNKDEVRVIAEPGRFYSFPNASLLVNVIAKAKTVASRITDNAEDKEDGFMYYVNDGVFGSFNCVPVYNINPPGIPINKINNSNTTWCRIWGPTCDSADCIWPKVRMPELQIGDWIAFDYMGSYTRCIASVFNGFDVPATVYLVNETDSKLLCMLKEKYEVFSKDLASPSTDSGADSDFSDSGSLDSLSERA